MSPHDVARESYEFWRSVGYRHADAIAWLAMEDGESSFRLGVVGDHGKAFGPFQHQKIRLDRMAGSPPHGCGIDIRNPSTTHLEALQAAHWETSEGPYKHVRPSLMGAQTPEEKVRLLVTKFEQSANPDDRDVRRRLALFNYWDGEFST